MIKSTLTKPFRNYQAILGTIAKVAGAVTIALGALSCSDSAQESTVKEFQVLVDQFGYRPQDPKVAVVIGPLGGDQPYELRNAETDEVIEVITPVKWTNGAVHSQSGERAWWVDFSDLDEPGKYVIVREDGETRSAEFEIRSDIYKDVLIAATRMFFYQRSGFSKTEPFADARWTDGAAYMGPGQDTQARFVDDKQNPATERAMHGGWFDAGDTNKYVTYTLQPVHQLLSAYSQNPKIWTDDFNIPESGNGIPDLLDEIKYELDWLIRMQDDDGGVFIKIGNLDYNPPSPIPSKDTRPRYYGPKCSSSTIAIASVFAHAAVEMQSIPELEDYAAELTSRARAAWDWFQVHPIDTDCDTGEIKSGDADMTADAQLGTTVSAAVYLFAATGDPQFSNYVVDNIDLAQPYRDGPWSRYDPWQGDALIFYSQMPDADAALKEEILTDLEDKLIDYHPEAYGSDDLLDPFRSYMPDEQYHWGSNMTKANYGNMNYDPVMLGIHKAEWPAYIERSLGAINYFHGVNPLGIVFLSNMYEYGAEYSANEMYHQWFGQGEFENALTSKKGPAPGFFMGGPYKDYSGDEAIASGPPMKAYIDDVEPNQPTYEIIEPAIYYQSAYIKLLSKFVTAEDN
ncbi:glycosyl hydrolase family 9 [Leptolyngbya sp. PCC 7375]|nr:glycosyl hydrolase family 9 [Leptolyngbya sp. PCC 7375]